MRLLAELSPLQKRVLEENYKGETLLQIYRACGSSSKEEFQQKLISDELTAEELKEIKTITVLENLKLHLNNCGQLAKRKFYCKQCEDLGREALLAEDKIRQTCGIRFCTKPKCVNTRFSRVLENLKSINRLKGLRKMWHFVIGFSKIPLEDFNIKFGEEKKRQERILNNYFASLRRKGIKIQAFKVLDLTFRKDDQGNTLVYMHWHFIAIPFKSSEQPKIMKVMKDTENKMKKYQKKKYPFHLQIMGNKSKSALFSYLSVRATGLYKRTEKKEKGYNIKTQRKLQDLIKAGKFVFLSEFISMETYAQTFYNRRYISSIGGLPYGSTIVDNLPDRKYVTCNIHGKMPVCDHNLVRWEILIDIPPPPPPNREKPLKIELIKLAGHCHTCGKGYYASEMAGSQCRFCNNNTNFKKKVNEFHKWVEDK